jgi:transketolase
LKETDKDVPDALVLATGSEVHLALDAAERLAEDGIEIRVISMPCWELFEKQTDDYKKSVLPVEISARVAIEAGATQGWHKYVGTTGEVIGLDHFGASAPISNLFSNFGITADAVVKAVKNQLHS